MPIPVCMPTIYVMIATQLSLIWEKSGSGSLLLPNIVYITLYVNVECPNFIYGISIWDKLIIFGGGIHDLQAYNEIITTQHSWIQAIAYPWYNKIVHIFLINLFYQFNFQHSIFDIDNDFTLVIWHRPRGGNFFSHTCRSYVCTIYRNKALWEFYNTSVTLLYNASNLSVKNHSKPWFISGILDLGLSGIFPTLSRRVLGAINQFYNG